jgi:inorganic phosphate transporter, PiT family
MLALLFLAACFLAYSNGANDNFKGVASLFGSRTCNYKSAIRWATVTTFSGSICAIFLAQSLLQRFSGKGLVPEEVVGSEYFLLAVAVGSGITVMLATVAGFPVSTTHGLTGAIIGSGLVAAGRQVHFASLGTGFVVPLLLSPALAVVLAVSLYVLFRFVRLRLGIRKEWCVCIGKSQQLVPVPQPAPVIGMASVPALSLSAGEEIQCAERYAGTYLGVNCQGAVDAAHYLSAGVVSFARGLNDTPKIAALLLTFQTLDIRWGMVAVAVAIALGGLLNARKVAETMSHKITALNAGQGFAANLSTGILVILASLLGLPVSTTHVAVGSLFGVGLVTRQADIRVATCILLSWVLTVPCAALTSGLVYWLMSQ